MTEPGFDFSALLAQAQQMQEGVMAAQASLDDVRVEGVAGGGLVTALVDGRGGLVELRLAPETPGLGPDPEDVVLLCDLVVAAVRAARQDADEAAAAQLAAATGGLGDALGGLLGGLGGGVEDQPAASPEGPTELPPAADLPAPKQP